MGIGVVRIRYKNGRIGMKREGMLRDCWNLELFRLWYGDLVRGNFFGIYEVYLGEDF